MSARDFRLAIDYLVRTDWNRRLSEFGDLRVDGYDVTMEFGTAGPPSGIMVSERLGTLWSALPEHLFLLKSFAPNRLRYAALDWSWRGYALGVGSQDMEVATIGDVLVRVYEHIMVHTSKREMAEFLTPLVYVGVEDVPRIAFGAGDPVTYRLPPEIRDISVRCDERSIVFAIGHALRRVATHVGRRSMLTDLIQACVHDNPRWRIQSLSLLAKELRLAGARPTPKNVQTAHTRFRSALEEGRGFLSVHLQQMAAARFADAARLLPSSVLARQLRRAAEIEVEHLPQGWPSHQPHPPVTSTLLSARKAGVDLVGPPPPVPPTGRSWIEAAASGAALERDRDFAAAELVYWNASTVNHDEVLARFTGIARCCFHRGNYEHTHKYADLALVVEPAWGPAFELKCNALLGSANLGSARFEDALEIAAKWCAAAPDDGDAHYARGKALLRLERHADARDAFDLALSIDPKLVEAMLLRRQVDIAMKNTRARVGSPATMQLDVPDDLPELRAAMVGGKLDEALALLSRTELDQHTAAQLYRGQILFFLERYDEALSVLDRLIAAAAGNLGEARYARARVLTALDWYDDALAELDIIRDAHPEIADAAATRAYVLDALGRPREAEVAELAYLGSARR